MHSRLPYRRADLPILILLAIAYYAAAQTGLLVAISPGYATAVWLPAGLMAAALLLLGSRFWPAVWIGTFFTIWTQNSATALHAIFIATGNTLEALFIIYLVRHHLSGLLPWKNLRDAALYVFGSSAAALISMLFGMSTWVGTPAVPIGLRMENLITWWLGDFASLLLITPVILAWFLPCADTIPARRGQEKILFVLGLVAFGYVIFNGVLPNSLTQTLPYIFVLFLIWAAFRFRACEAATVSLAIAVMALAGALQMRGPFAVNDLYISLILLQIFLSILSTAGIVVIAASNERQRAEADLRRALGELEKRVAERTQELEQTNRHLQTELNAHQEAENRIRDLSRFLDTIIDNANVLVSVLDNQNNYLIWNKAAERITGFQREEVLGNHDVWQWTYPDPDYRQMILAKIQNVRDGQSVEDLHLVLHTRSGEQKTISFYSHALKDGQGNVTGLVNIGIDITARKQAEAQLLNSQKRLADIINFLPDATFAIDRAGCIIAWNHAMEEMTRLPAEEMIGKGNHEYALPFYGQRRPMLVDLAIHRQESSAAFYPQIEIANDGLISEVHLPDFRTGNVYLWVKATPLYDSDGQVVGAIESIRDITTRKRAEQAESAQRALAEALRDTAAVLNSSLGLDEVMDYILGYVGKVVPNEAVNIMMIEQGEAKIVRTRGYEHAPNRYEVLDLGFKVQDSPTLLRMVETKKPVVIADTHNDPAWYRVAQTEWVRSYAGAPIIIQGEVVGCINLDSSQLNFYTAEHAHHLMAFANQAAIAMQNARLYATLQHEAITDALTGIYNRLGLYELGQREVARSRRFGRPLSAIFLDIDHFKVVNDTFGHAVGDEVLRSFSLCCCANRTRGIDIVGRYGGEEFVLLLPETDLQDAYQVAERLRMCIEASPIETSQGSLYITASLGVATVSTATLSLDELIAQADQAMYAAKQAGRNRVKTFAEIQSRDR